MDSLRVILNSFRKNTPLNRGRRAFYSEVFSWLEDCVGEPNVVVDVYHLVASCTMRSGSVMRLDLLGCDRPVLRWTKDGKVVKVQHFS